MRLRDWVGGALESVGERILDLGISLLVQDSRANRESKEWEPIEYGYIVKPLYTPASDYLESMGTYHYDDYDEANGIYTKGEYC